MTNEDIFRIALLQSSYFFGLTIGFGTGFVGTGAVMIWLNYFAG